MKGKSWARPILQARQGAVCCCQGRTGLFYLLGLPLLRISNPVTMAGHALYNGINVLELTGNAGASPLRPTAVPDQEPAPPGSRRDCPTLAAVQVVCWIEPVYPAARFV